MQQFTFLTCKLIFEPSSAQEPPFLFSPAHGLITRTPCPEQQQQAGVCRWFVAASLVPRAHPHVAFADRLTPSRRGSKVQWCAIGRDEKKKCDVWSVMSNGDVECVVAEDTTECITKIMVQHFFPFLLTVNFSGASFAI